MNSEGTTINIGIVATDEASEALQAAADSVAELDSEIADSTPGINAMSADLDRVGASGIAAGDSIDTITGAADAAAGSVALMGDATVEGAGAAAGASSAAAGATADLSSELGTSAVAAETAGSEYIGMGNMIKNSILPLAELFLAFEGGKAIFEDAKQQTDQLNAANAQMANTLKNTHDAIGMNVTQIDKLAAATAKGTDFTKASNSTVAAQFIALQGMNSTTMPQAIKLTDDLATKMAVMKGQSVPSMQQTTMAAKEMAKALQDPTTATAAFARAGVTLTSTQIAQIKAIAANSNATDKQALSIKGVTAAGAAALANWSNLTAVQQTAAEKADGLTAAQITQAKAFGTANAQTVAQKQLMTDLSGYVSGAAAAAAQTFSGKLTMLKNTLAEDLIPVMKDVEHYLEDVGSAFLSATEYATKHRVILVAIASAVLPVLVMGLAAGAVGLWGMAAGAIGAATGFTILGVSMLPIILIAAAVGAIAYEIVTHWKTIKPFFETLWKDIKAGFDDLVGFLKDVGEVVLAILLLPLVPAALAWHFFHDQITAVVKSIVNDVEAVFKPIISFFTTAMADIVKAVTDPVKSFGTLLYDAGKDLINGLVKGIEASVGDVENAVKGVGKTAIDAAKSVLKIFSPSQVFSDIGGQVGAGLVQGIKGAQAAVAGAGSALAQAAIPSVGASSVGSVASIANASTGVNALPSTSSSTAFNNTTSNSASVTIQNLVLQLPNGATMQTFLDSLDRDTQLTSQGLSPARGIT